MYLLLDTSTPVCRVTLVTHGGQPREHEWQADRQLAKGLLRFLRETLEAEGASFQDIQGVGVLRGPGSFTGLRIGLTVMNTLAEARQIPIVGGEGEDWQGEVLRRLRLGEDDKIVLPRYDREAHITQPRK